MKVTNVRVKKIENKNRLKGVATITFDECFVIHELRLIEGKNGLFVAMPSKRNTQGEFRDVCHPINKDLRQHIEDVVILAFNEIKDEPNIDEGLDLSEVLEVEEESEIID
jgi:stage V sporulation protein G